MTDNQIVKESVLGSTIGHPNRELNRLEVKEIRSALVNFFQLLVEIDGEIGEENENIGSRNY